jgi:hypothetical protein
MTKPPGQVDSERAVAQLAGQKDSPRRTLMAAGYVAPPKDH